jgi:hypothetical protein
MLFSANSSHIRSASMSGDVQSCIAFLRSSKDRNRLTCVYNPIFDFWTLTLCYLNLEKFTSNTWTSLKLTLSLNASQNLTLQTRIASIKVFHSAFLYFSSFLFFYSFSRAHQLTELPLPISLPRADRGFKAQLHTSLLCVSCSSL